MNLTVDKTKEGLTESVAAYCCNDIRKAFNDKLIGFGNINDPHDPTNNTVNLYRYDSDTENHEMYPINNCPFCGTRIEIYFVDLSITE